MKRWIISLVLCLCVCLLLGGLGFRVEAADVIASGSCGDSVKWTLDSDGVLTIRGSGKMHNYSDYSSNRVPWDSLRESIHSVVIEQGVTSIGSWAFFDCSSLTSVTLPDSVTSIGDHAFSDCTGLTSITLPDGVTCLEDFVFYGCTGLTSITIPNGTTSIGGWAFYGCTALTSVTIPDSVTSIGSSAFAECSSLHSISLPNGISSISHSAFSGCTGLTSVTIPNSITSIENSAFFNCIGLTSITIPNGTTSIGHHAFFNCTGLTSITIPDSVTSIEGSAFSCCTKLSGIWVGANHPAFSNDEAGALFNKEKTTLISYPGGISGAYEIPDSVTSIGDNAFYGCTGLTSVTISDGTTSIGDRAFYDCTGLTSIAIPDSVTSIGSAAFSGCTGLTSVTIPNGTMSIGDSAFYGCNRISSVYLSSVESWLVSSWGAAIHANLPRSFYLNGEPLTDLVIPDGTTSIGYRAFYGCTGLTSVTIPDSVTSIGESAFYGCTGLASITIPNGTTSIGGWAFYGCTGLTSVTLPDSVTSIGANAFYGCTGLTSITIPDEITLIPWGTFAGCSSLTRIALPRNLKSIGVFAFSGCSSLTSISLPDGLTTIGDGAFQSTALTSIYIPSSVAEIGTNIIGSNVFSYCDDLLHITVDKNNLNYCADTYGVLYNKRKTELIQAPAKANLGEYVIPDGVTDLALGSFYGCKRLTSVAIPDSVTHISVGVFENCTGLTEISLPANLNVLGSYAFSGCTALKSIALPEHITRVESYAFDGCTALKEVVFSTNTTSIENGAFRNCSALANVALPSGITNIGEFAFYGCSSLKNITIPTDVSTIRKCSFANCTALQSMCFQGDAPQCKADAFSWMDEDSAASINNPNLTIYYIDGKEGWTTPMWNGYPSATWDGVNLPKPHEHDYKTVVTAPTCTEQGYTTHTCECGASYVDAYTDALGHDWGDPVYEWADDHSAITATRVCKRDPDHAETENGVVTSAVTKEATYDAEGEITYTATFANPAFEPQTAVVSLPRLERPTPTPAENPFTDIRESAYYHDPVLWAVANNVTNGTSAATFSPDEGCTRAQVVTFLWRAAGKPDPASSESPFSDVKEGAYYYNAVLWAVEKGITNGTSDKTFSPDETCTRAQIVTFLWRYEEQPASAGTSNPFADVKPSAYFGSAVLWAVEKGITNGTSATTFDPEDTCTRAQVVTFLYRDIVKS